MPGRPEQSECPTPPDLAGFLARVEFPASRSDLVALATGEGSQSVRQTLEALEPEIFDSPAAVEAAVTQLSR